MTWTAIVITCRDNTEANTFRHQLELRQKKGRLDKNVIVLSLPDPKCRVGSGGATLNALLVVTEHISARAGYTVVNGDVLQDAKILILHAGRDFALDPCGRAFVQMPMLANDDVMASPICNLDLLLASVSRLASKNGPGLWVCSTDMFVDIPDAIDTSGCDVCVLSVPGSRDYAKQHGVLKLDSEGGLRDVIYQGTAEQLGECVLPSGKLPLVSGIQYMTPTVTEKLVAFHTMPPLDACTYMGLDSGAQPIQISLFFDLLLPMCSDVTVENFVNGSRSGLYGKRNGKGDSQNNMHAARALIWKYLHTSKAKVVLCEQGSHSYMTLAPSMHLSHLVNPVVKSLPGVTTTNKLHSFMHREASCEDTSVLINSRLTEGVHVGKRCVLSHAYIHTPMRIGDETIVNGVWTLGLEHFQGVILPDRLVLQTFHIRLPGLTASKHIPVLTVLGLGDNLEGAINKDKSTYCNQLWTDFLQRTGITEFDLWSPDMPESERSLMSARLFPVAHPHDSVDWSHTLWLCGALNIQHQLHKWRECWRLSLADILSHVDVGVEFDWRKTQFFWIAEQIVKDTILNQRDTGLNQLYRAAVVEGTSQQMLKLLDQVAMECDNPGVAARVLANIADVLGSMADNSGGLRSGPALNASWKPAFQLLEDGKLRLGIEALSREREQWLGTASQLIRAARHYEGAAQILIRHAVMTARQFIKTSAAETPSLDSWVTVECPARIDIAGGWSDTPPITYEHCGAVINAAILLDDQRPIGAKVRKIDSLDIRLHLGLNSDNVLVLSNLWQLSDYSSPQAPGALLKAAFICSDIIQFPSQVSLEEQLRKHGGGFELHTWSNLPHGSGLGTSSILAGAIMAALWLGSGQQFDIQALNHAVLHLEQMLTTGGGWQDQVGGLTPGIKVGHSPASLPLHVDMTYPDISAETVKAFSDRLILIYTGKTRLARNLLQNVIRNWYARDPGILKTEDDLVATAWQCARAFEQGNLEEIGACMDKYWQQKKHMAPGCEPHAVTCLMTSLRRHAHGISMAGAGGGGFLYVLMKQPKTPEQVMQLLSGVKDVSLENMTVHRAEVDTQGMIITCDTRGRVTIPLKLS